MLIKERYSIDISATKVSFIDVFLSCGVSEKEKNKKKILDVL